MSVTTVPSSAPSAPWVVSKVAEEELPPASSSSVQQNAMDRSIVSAREAAGCYMYVGCAPPIPFPILACLSAEGDDVVKEFCWAFPIPICCLSQRWVRDSPDSNWFTEQGDQGLHKELISANSHRENRGYFTCCKLTIQRPHILF